MSEHRIVRLRRLVVATAVAGVVSLALLALMAVLAFSASAPIFGIAAVLASVAVVFATVRGMRVGAVVRDDGLDIRGPWGTKSLQWDEVERFSVGPIERLRTAGVAELRDGSRLRVHGLSGRGIDPFVDELNGELEARR